MLGGVPKLESGSVSFLGGGWGVGGGEWVGVVVGSNTVFTTSYTRI